MLNEFELTGRERTHILQLEDPRCAVHHDVVAPFMALRKAAAGDGIELSPYSSFRDFDAQLRIWNRKFRGKRPLYDADGKELEYSSLSEQELVDCILSWSALPGASRHHWGTEIDVIDAAALPPGYHARLLPEEFAPGGVFDRLSEWLDRHLDKFAFFRPYAEYRGGVHREPWHLSYAPIAGPALEALSLEMLERTIIVSDVLGKETVLARLPDIYRRFVLNILPPRDPDSEAAPGSTQ